MFLFFIRYFPALALAGFIIASPAAANDREDCAKSNDFQRAIAACSAVIRQAAEGWAYVNRSYAYERLEKYDDALADGDMAVRLSPSDSNAYLNRAAALIGLRRYERAIEDTTTALRINPRNAVAHVNRAYAYEQLKQRDRAIADYRRALEIDGSENYAREALQRLGAGP